jgi:hypothetical protein
MTDLFLTAARGKFRFRAAAGLLTTEQLFDLPLTSTTGKSNLNDVAINIADEIDRAGTRSFVASATPDPQRTLLAQQLEIVKAIIEIKQAENAAARAKLEKRAERDRLLDAIEQADRRELGSKSADELRAQLAKLD